MPDIRAEREASRRDLRCLELALNLSHSIYSFNSETPHERSHSDTA